jgi:hypothetical protein
VGDSNIAAPFANIVVPTGTEFELEGYLGGEMGPEQWIDVTNESYLGDSMMMADAARISLPAPAEDTVPEPTGFTAVAIAGSGLLLRRRRRRTSG